MRFQGMQESSLRTCILFDLYVPSLHRPIPFVRERKPVCGCLITGKLARQVNLPASYLSMPFSRWHCCEEGMVLFLDDLWTAHITEPGMTPPHLFFSNVNNSKALICSARHVSSLAHLRTIFECTHSILFFGTPHNGSEKARTLHTVEKILSVSSRARIFKAKLNISRDLSMSSERLDAIKREFELWIPKFSIYFFWEMKRTKMGYKSDYIVERNSAAPEIPGAESFGIESDHSGIVKFENCDSVDFKRVAQIIVGQCLAAVSKKTTPQVVPERQQTRIQQTSILRSPMKQTLVQHVETTSGVPKYNRLSMTFENPPSYEASCALSDTTIYVTKALDALPQYKHYYTQRLLATIIVLIAFCINSLIVYVVLFFVNSQV